MDDSKYWSPKFGHDPVAEALWTWSMDSSQDDTCGTTEDIGWHALFHVSHGEGVEISTGKYAYVPRGVYILTENDQGFVDYQQFEYGSGDAEMAWRGIQDAEDKFHEPEPEEEDGYITFQHGAYQASFAGGFVGAYDEQDKAEKEIRRIGRASGFFPNVWVISDHGNPHLIEDFWEDTI